MSNNKSSKCNTTFDDTYFLYKYNIGIDIYHIRNRDEKRHAKRQTIKVVNVMTLTLSYTSII